MHIDHNDLLLQAQALAIRHSGKFQPFKIAHGSGIAYATNQIGLCLH